MGLDVTLGVIILVAAFRGWIQGFVIQAVRLAGLVACVYLAEPVRNYAKPYVLPYLPSVQPALIDRLLWWVSAVISYIVVVGVATLVIKMTRRPEIPGMAQSSRNDQFAGFMLGAAKGVLIAAFAAAGVQKYAMQQIKTVAWADEQAKTSWALKWNDRYQPAPRIWASPPVQHFVSYVERMGLRTPGEPSQSSTTDDELTDDEPTVRTARRSADDKFASDTGHTRNAQSGLPSAAGDQSNTASAAEKLDPDDQAIADLKAELKKRP